MADVFHAFRNGKNDPARREHLIILTAIEEMIRERKPSQQHKQQQQQESLPSANEYFAAIMTALEAKDQSHTPELVCLLDTVMAHVDKSVLRSKFKPISNVLVLLLKTNLEHEMTAFVRDLVSCLGKLLLAQEVSSAAWSSPVMLKTFYMLLSCFREKRPKIRKTAMSTTLDLLRLHASRKVWALGKQVVEFANNVLEACTASDCLPTLHLLGFLQEGLSLLPEKEVCNLMDRILRLQALENSLVVLASMQTLRSLVRAQGQDAGHVAAAAAAVAAAVSGGDSSATTTTTVATVHLYLPTEKLLQLAEGVLELQPRHDEKDVEVCRTFCDLVAACLECLGKRKEAAKARQKLLPRAMQALVARCESDSPVVHEAACGAMRMALASAASGAAAAGAADEDKKTATATAADVKSVTDALAAVSKLLDYRYQRSWGVCLPFLGSLFIHFRQEAGGLLDPLLQKLAFLHDAVASSSPALVKPFDACIALAVEGLGIEKVLEVLPLEGGGQGEGTGKGKTTTAAAAAAAAEAESLAINRRATWLLPLLASHGKRQSGHLAYFQEHILAMAKRSNEVVSSGKVSSKQLHHHRHRVLQLWALLPAFCSHPMDLATAFGNLAPVLASVLQDENYPELLFTVCQSLQLLIHFAQEEAENETTGGAAGGGSSSNNNNKKANLEAMSALSKKFLPVLFNILDNCPLEDSSSGVKVRALSETISAYALIAPKSFVASLFKKLVQKMLEATQHQQVQVPGQHNHKAVILCELALALVPSLDEASITLLYKVIKPLVCMDKDVALQKRAYRVLGALCEHHGERFLSRKETLEDLLPVLTDSLLTCHVSARQMRLRVLGSVIKTLDGEDAAHWDLLVGLVGEVLLCLKDANGKAREAAYQVLSIMAQMKGEDDMAEFSQVVLAALAAETPHMRSAAVLALAHLIFEFAPQRPAFRATIPELLATVLLLGSDPVKEVVKSVVSFVRICVAACPLEGLEAQLPAIIDCLFASNSKVRFRAKIKIILKKLCRKFGYEHILALAPATDRKLITHIQKQAQRGDRISAVHAAAVAAGGGASHHASGYEEDEEDDEDGRFESLFGNDDEDDDDEDDDDDGMDDGEEGGEAAENSNPFAIGRRNQMLKAAAAAAAGGGKAEKRKRGDGKGMMVRDSEGIIDLLDSSMIQNLKLRGGKGRQARDARAGAASSSSLLAKRSRYQDEEGGDESGDDDNEGSDMDDEVLEFNEEGKLVIPDDLFAEGDEDAPNTPGFDLMDIMREDMVESDDEDDKRRGNKRHKRADGFAGRGGGGGGGGGGGRDNKKKFGNKGQAPGMSYKSKKAGGDLKKKGQQLEPYAYIPLNAKTMIGKKMKGEAAKTFGAVVGSKKGRREEKKNRGGRR